MPGARRASGASAVAVTLSAFVLVAGGALVARETRSGVAPVAPGALAAFAPPDSVLYAEVVLRPDEERRYAIETLISRFTERPADLAVGQAVDRALAGAYSPVHPPLTYARDVRPWLGQRGAVFARELEPPPLGAAFGEGLTPGLREAIRRPITETTLALSVVDAEAARDAMERAITAAGAALIEEVPAVVQSSRTRTYDHLGHEIFTKEERFGEERAGAVVGDVMVLGTPGGVEAAINAYEGDSFADARSFANAVGRAARAEALALAVVDTRYALFRDLGSEPYPLPAGLVRELAGRLAVDVSRPTTVTVEAAPNELRLERTLPLSRPVPLGRSAGLVRRAPRDVWLAYTDPLLVGTFTELMKLGIDRAAKRRRLSPSESDFVRSALRSIGDTAAVFARGTDASDVAGALVLSVDRARALGGPLDLAELIFLGVPRARFLPLAPLPGRPPGFSVLVPDLPVALQVGLGPRNLGVVAALNGRGLRRAAAPASTFGRSKRFAELELELGQGYEPTGYLDLGAALEAIGEIAPQALASADPAALEAAAGITVGVGARSSPSWHLEQFRLEPTDP